MGEPVKITVAGQEFICGCGCSLFTKHSWWYSCNNCLTQYLGNHPDEIRDEASNA